MVELLKTKRYPGRFIVIGKDGDAFVALYGATGRSPSSVARRFIRTGNGIYTVATDDTVAREGNPELLEYPAVRFFENGLAIANGRHIEKITELQSRDARKQLSYILSEEAYEPDEYRTPRITGCLIQTANGMDGALHIVRSAPDGIDHSSWSVPLEPGKGMFISTYAGEDVKPTPSGQPDYRIGIVAVYLREDKEPEIAIQNRQ